MEKKQVFRLLFRLFVFSYGLFAYCYIGFLVLLRGFLNGRTSEKETLELQLGRMNTFCQVEIGLLIHIYQQLRTACGISTSLITAAYSIIF